MIKTTRHPNNRLPKEAADWIASLCAVFMLCVVPLLFHDAFFDINRFKVNAVLTVVPVICFLWGVAVLLGRSKQRAIVIPSFSIPALFLLLFLASCVFSCARLGFPRHTLTGENGRYCGLFFMLACGASFFVMSSGEYDSDIIVLLAILTGALIAALGVLNALGVDPLGFYTGIKKGQEQVFLSTIGHFDFFGTYLILILGLAAGYSSFAKRRCIRIFARLSAAVIALGMSAARTDSAFLGLHLVCFAIAAISGGSFLHMGRAFMLWALCTPSLPVMHVLFPLSPYGAEFSGLPLLMCRSGAAVLLAVILLLLSAFFYVLQRRGVLAIGRKRLQRVFFIAMLMTVFLLLSVIVYFTVFDKDAGLAGAASVLRFNDTWGSYRGFVYMRSLRAYGDYTFTEKLWGKGLDSTLSILTPYFDNPEIIAHGVFNDTHCQPLQMLLTCGAVGMLTFMAFYVSVMIRVLRHAGSDPLLCGAFCALAGYLIVLAINVTQPILISTYVSLAAIAICRVNSRRREESMDES